EINGSDDSDRMLVNWRLGSQAVMDACAGSPRHAHADVQADSIALSIAPDGGPKLGALDGQTLLVAVPENIEAMRLRDPGCAKDWRVAVRDSLGVLLTGGARVVGFDRAGWYVVQRGDVR